MTHATSVLVIESYDPADYPEFITLYDEDEQLHVDCYAHCHMERSEYGYDIEDVEVVDYTVNGQTLDPRTAQQIWGETLEKTLNKMCRNKAEREGEWEC